MTIRAMLMCLAGVFQVLSSMAFQGEVQGTVYDESNQPLMGVSVRASSTGAETATNDRGEFRLAAVTGDTLTFTFLGYQQATAVVDGKPVLVTLLAAGATDLEEVVIVGYGTQKKSNLTGAVSAVNAKELTNISPSNLSNTLAGRAPGVNVTNTSGLSGATSSIRIRGGFGEPLYVIDGVVRDKAAFDALEAFEVDQMSFLKDAATASIYGSRAGNGVVLVTTRKGTQQKPTFTFQSNYTIGTPTMPLLSDLTTATDELIYQNRVAEFNGTPLPNGEEEFAYFQDKSYNVHDFIWRNPTSHRQSLSVSGGSERVTYYSLLSYRGEQGSYKSVDHGKFNLRSNVSAKINESISIDLNLSAYQQSGDRFYWPFTGDDDYDVSDLYRVTFNWPKTYPFYTEADGTPADYVTDYPVQTPMGSWLAWSVIDQVIGDRYIKTRERQFNPILSLNFNLDKVIPGLSTKVVGSYLGEDFMRKKYLTFQTNYQFIPADPDGNRFIPAPPDPNRTNTFNFSQNQPFLDYELENNWAYQFNWFLNYNHTFGKHGIDALLVFEQAEDGLFGAYARGENPITDYDQMFAYPTDRQFREADGWEEIGARQSYIGRVNYNYDNRYIAEFSFRHDGNTLFPEHKRWGFFPSVSAAWRISEEAFFQHGESAVNDLKLRASYGTTGNDLMISTTDRIPAFSYVNRYVNAGGYMFGDRYYSAIAPGPTPSPNLTWATSTSYNAGLDIGVFNSRLTGTLDVFLREETDILGPRLVSVPDNYGQALAPENYAARSWRGGELALQWNDRLAANNEISYSVNANLGYARDRWDIYDESAAFGPEGYRHFESRIGLPHDRIIGLKALGIVRTQEQLDELLATGFKQYGRDPYLGGLYFEDVRGDGYAPGPDGKIDGNDMQLLSTNGAPRINYGFGFDFSYKNFTLQAHFQGVANYDHIISNQEGPGMRQHGGAIRPYYPIWASDEVWTPENPDGKYPRPIGQNWYESGTEASSFWIRNGAYLRLRTLNLAYSLPKNWQSAMHLGSAQLFFNGTNLFFLSAMKEFHDPEQKNYDSYPVMKTFTFGLDVSF
ncbi:SusC/RagA family TonB-linked outer membrane protein [Parapedobacter sp. DT-150]|uniref:SusC/RagA family TonB-linked outer membrane protein n=1 Tax=Parapedobacter sp. DT-150 TaxID=3396162 RepID=UPI003F1A3107